MKKLIYRDEMVNLYKLLNTISRNNNYEQILRILNDILIHDNNIN
ncbi:MAG: ATP-binding protein [Rickettsiales bacterium]|nr:ATP-binding protein [Rickettsiales bacterium]